VTFFPFSSTFYEFFCVPAAFISFCWARQAQRAPPFVWRSAWLGCIFNFSKRRLEATPACTSFSHLVLAPGFFVFCAAPEGALRCVNRMLMANYAGAPHPLCAPRRVITHSAAPQLDYSECETLGAAMINSAGELPWLCAQIEANYARRGTKRRRAVKRFHLRRTSWIAASFRINCRGKN
jgi:hypothetical protein